MSEANAYIGTQVVERLARLEEKADVGARDRQDFRAAIERLHAKMESLGVKIDAVADDVLTAKASIRALSWAGRLVIAIVAMLGAGLGWLAGHWPMK